VLAAELGVPTIPQIYIGGEHIGGASDLFDSYSDGTLQRKMRQMGIAYDSEAEINPMDLLPQWLHPRKTA
jgi:cysteine synthase A